MADVTYFYRWGPREAQSLTWRELDFWLTQAERINKAQGG